MGPPNLLKPRLKSMRATERVEEGALDLLEAKTGRDNNVWGPRTDNGEGTESLQDLKIEMRQVILCVLVSVEMYQRSICNFARPMMLNFQREATL